MKKVIGYAAVGLFLATSQVGATQPHAAVVTDHQRLSLKERHTSSRFVLKEKFQATKLVTLLWVLSLVALLVTT